MIVKLDGCRNQICPCRPSRTAVRDGAGVQGVRRFDPAAVAVDDRGGEMCVCELTDAFALSGPTTSHHLKCSGRLRAARQGGYYRGRRDGASRALAAARYLGDHRRGRGVSLAHAG
ncbi:ArsR family transcriptional regulator [Actinoplanes campanulatus]|uniref:ArsR family transcriptional regulator n=1 Tax=Actinoplanes campanulatus TaxID=113559 RepID=UPI00357153D5